MGLGGKFVWLEVVGTEVVGKEEVAGLILLAGLLRLEDGQD